MIIKLSLKVGYSDGFSSYIPTEDTVLKDELVLHVNENLPNIGNLTMLVGDWLQGALHERDLVREANAIKIVKEKVEERTKSLQEQVSTERNRRWDAERKVSELECQIRGLQRAAGADVPSSPEGNL